MDSDGISTYKQLYRRWMYRENLYLITKHLIVRPFEPSLEPPCIEQKTGSVYEKPFYIESDKIMILAERLRHRFDAESLIQLIKATQ